VVGTMYRIVLSSTQKQELERVFKRTEDRRLRARCQAVLMAARGRVGPRRSSDDVAIMVAELSRARTDGIADSVGAWATAVNILA